jgi:mutator protein MutT
MEEMVEVVDDDFNVLKVVSRREAIKNLWKHKGAAVILRNKKGDFFIKLRSKNKKIHASLWEIGTGGAVKFGENFEQAALRELFEECGIKTAIKFLFDFDYCDSEICYKARIFEGFYDGKIIVNKSESEEGKWVSLKELKEFLKKGLFAPDYDKLLKKYIELKKI